jgi:hypothetical protein
MILIRGIGPEGITLASYCVPRTIRMPLQPCDRYMLRQELTIPAHERHGFQSIVDTHSSRTWTAYGLIVDNLRS